MLQVVPEKGMNPEQRDDLQRILRNGYHLLELVNDVLDLEKIEAQHMVITLAPVDIKHLLSSVVEETRSIADSRQLILRAEMEENIGFIESDPMRLQQVLLNLLSNALKFTKQGEVLISARRIAGPEQPGAIAISVKDSGIGISLDKQNMIFEAFYQVDGSYTREFGGTGLGLSIVSQLTRLLGGKVEVDSVPGVGSTFTVTLPITATRQPEAKLLPRLHPTSMTTLATAPLGADDDPSSSQRWLDEIRQEANTQQSTVVLVVDDDPDAITLDVMMPHINDWQLLHQLKDNPSSAAIPVVIISVPRPLVYQSILKRKATMFMVNRHDDDPVTRCLEGGTTCQQVI